MGQAAGFCCGDACCDTGETACDACACCDTGKDNLLGLMVKNAIMSFDKGLLGVDVHVGSMRMVPRTWRLEIEDLVMDNPEGYKTEYLLKVSRLYLDIDASSILTSFGKKATVEELTCEGVDLNYEPRIGTSNLTEVKAHLKSLREQEETDKTKRAEVKKKNRVEVILHRVALKGVRVKMNMLRVGGFGPLLRVSDIVYRDFSQEFKGRTAVMDIVRILLGTVLKSVLGTVTENVKGAGNLAINGAKSSVNLAAYGAKAIIGGIVSGSSMALKCVKPEVEMNGGNGDQGGSHNKG